MGQHVASIMERCSALGLVSLLITVFCGSLIHVASRHVFWNECLSCEFPLDLWNECQTQRMQLCLKAEEAFHYCYMLPQHLADLLLLSVCSLLFAERSVCVHRWSYFQLLIMAASTGNIYHRTMLQQWHLCEQLNIFWNVSKSVVWKNVFLICTTQELG